MADISQTAANVVPYSDAQTKDALAGATIVAGKPVYLDANNLAQIADANLSVAAAAAVGIALNGASLNQPIKIQFGGGINPGGTVVVGTPYFVSATNAGGIAPASDLATGWFVTFLGIGITASKIQMPSQGPIVSGIAVP